MSGSSVIESTLVRFFIADNENNRVLSLSKFTSERSAEKDSLLPVAHETWW
jgi:hypothetical protein